MKVQLTILAFILTASSWALAADEVKKEDVKGVIHQVEAMSVVGSPPCSVCPADSKSAKVNESPAEQLNQPVKKSEKKKTIKASHQWGFVTNKTGYWTEERIRAWFQKRLTPELYRECVRKTRDENKCEPLPDSLKVWRFDRHFDAHKNRWDSFSGAMSMSMKKDDIDGRWFGGDKVFRGYAIDQISQDPTLKFDRAAMEKKLEAAALKDAMDDCVRTAGDPSLCVAQPKTFSVYEDDRSLDRDYGIEYKNYSSEYYVVWKRSSSPQPKKP